MYDLFLENGFSINKFNNRPCISNVNDTKRISVFKDRNKNIYIGAFTFLYTTPIGENSTGFRREYKDDKEALSDSLKWVNA